MTSRSLKIALAVSVALNVFAATAVSRAISAAELAVSALCASDDAVLAFCSTFLHFRTSSDTAAARYGVVCSPARFQRAYSAPFTVVPP